MKTQPQRSTAGFRHVQTHKITKLRKLGRGRPARLCDTICIEVRKAWYGKRRRLACRTHRVRWTERFTAKNERINGCLPNA